MSSKNVYLNNSKKFPNDEYYTLHREIKLELDFVDYQNYLKDKIVYCNCDNENSEFVKYLKNQPQIKELIYSSTDFRSPENIEKLKYCDVVITNPPFSLIREYFNLLFKEKKKYLIIAPVLAAGYSIIYNNLSLSWSRTYNRNMAFSNGKHIKIGWYTNISLPNRKIHNISLTKTFDPNYYKTIKNSNIINVDRVKEIPIDYYGLIAVPISVFKYKLEDDIFDIGGFRYKFISLTIPLLEDDKKLFSRYIIQRV